MSYSHPDIVFSKSTMKRLNIQTLSTRPLCPFCHKGALINELIRDGDHYHTYCAICHNSVLLDDHWKVFFYDVDKDGKTLHKYYLK